MSRRKNTIFASMTTNDKPEVVSVGENIRRVRKNLGLTLKNLSRKSGVSVASISRIETGKVSGGFENIYKIARALGILVADLVEYQTIESEAISLHRYNTADIHPTRLYNYFPQALRKHGYLTGYEMEILTREIPKRIDWSIHDGEELIFVLSGKIQLLIEGQDPVDLEKGDSACFDSGLRHAFVCKSKELARIYSVSTRNLLSQLDG